MTADGVEIVPLERLELKYAPTPWTFAQTRRAEIDAHFAAARRDKPALFNGQVLLLCDGEIEAGVLRGTFFATDFASFLAWQRFGDADSDVVNCYAMGAVQGADGGLLLGVMGPHTANAGQIYFPAGTPDPSDIVGDRVDLEASVWREVAEETGLTQGDLTAVPGWAAVRHGRELALIKTMRADVGAQALAHKVQAHLAADPEPELSGIRIVRGERDLDPAMRDYIVAYLRYVWR